jgi:hypothetical protein
MQRQPIPFNVSLLELTPQKVQGLKPVRSLDIFDGAGSNFHDDGLFSASTFGKVGDERRNLRFSFIDIKVPIFHPVVYRALIGLKRLYAGIIAGTEYAVWDKDLKDFDRADAVTGQTGYAFFVSKWREIEFQPTKSDKREQSILLLKKYADKAMTTKVIVMPAGLRDIELSGDGRIQKDEINDFYADLLRIANTISDASTKSNLEMINTARYRLQTTFNGLYDSIESMVEGKKKLLMGKWASRRIQNGTRNVITSMNTSVAVLGAPGSVKFNDTMVGLYQTLKAIQPVARFQVRHGFLSKVFTGVGAPAKLVNKKTLHQEEVQLKNQYFDRFMTDEGVEKVITSFGDENLRHRQIEIDGRWLGLIYKGPDGTFKLLQDIDEVPAGRDRAHVTPLTLCELLYLSTYRVLNKHPIFVTRYPVTGVGSIYPSKIYVRTTIRSETRRELNDQWEPIGDSHVAYEFPIPGDAFVNSLVPHSAKLAKLGADFDGDTVSGNAAYSDEAIQEVDNFLTKKRAYVGTDGNFISSTSVSTVNLVMHNLTGD